MAEEITQVEETTEQPAPVETNVEVDYEKEFEEASKKAANAAAYEKRHQKKEETSETQVPDDLADQVAAKLFPKLQATVEQSAVEVHLERRSGGNESLKKLIKFHLENSVNPSLPIDQRIDAAFAIANSKVIEKTAKEINVARQNRSQISNIGQGQSSEQQTKPGSNVLSEAQLNELKRIARVNRLDEKKFIENTIKRMTQ